MDSWGATSYYPSTKPLFFSRRCIFMLNSNPYKGHISPYQNVLRKQNSHAYVLLYIERKQVSKDATDASYLQKYTVF